MKTQATRSSAAIDVDIRRRGSSIDVRDDFETIGRHQQGYPPALRKDGEGGDKLQYADLFARPPGDKANSIHIGLPTTGARTSGKR